MDSFRQETGFEGGIVSGIMIFNEPQNTFALGAAWQDTFSAKPFRLEKSKLYLDNLGDVGPYSQIPPPDYWIFHRAVARGPNSSPGPDGLPYAAWRASKDFGITTLRSIDFVLRNGAEPDKYFK